MTHRDSLPPDSELLQLQTRFTQHLRNPDLHPVPDGLDPRRMGIYSSLIFNNISALASEFFPVIHSITDPEDWQALIREFFINYRAETPYFPKLADEFLQFLMGRKGNNQAPDYLVPLAHYEWIELCLYTSEAELGEKLSPEALTTQRIHLCELAIPVAYDFPVHQIQKAWVEEIKPTHLLVFRDQTDSIRFFDIQPLVFELLKEMSQPAGTLIESWLTSKAKEMNQTPEMFIDFGMGLINKFNDERLLEAVT